MSDGMTEAFRGTYFKSRNSQTKKKTNKYNQPKGKWVNLYYPNKTVPNKKKAFKNKRIKVIKNYSER
ncbi:hypothetical protein HGD80_02645 [Paulownia witches'-broom phytoplasma]|uniref:Uncharacterized protein n=1 Tax=Paulownia witches'-broom phytoplasma TaxID=39647 RepID=A0ABX8TNH2_9MOLU|nr:hypothetical protein [Paulownia witches'-broom phytoplasma]QYC30726.1 hypothetical protein HGD80_02645 [Paulownia witches'-broom phytoplasma]GLH61028.1 hypothetical protein PAWBP_7660 [Paulownia witches'-broom phytoplasma]